MALALDLCASGANPPAAMVAARLAHWNDRRTRDGTTHRWTVHRDARRDGAGALDLDGGSGRARARRLRPGAAPSSPARLATHRPAGPGPRPDRGHPPP